MNKSRHGLEWMTLIWKKAWKTILNTKWNGREWSSDWSVLLWWCFWRFFLWADIVKEQRRFLQSLWRNHFYPPIRKHWQKWRIFWLVQLEQIRWRKPGRLWMRTRGMCFTMCAIQMGKSWQEICGFLTLNIRWRQCFIRSMWRITVFPRWKSPLKSWPMEHPIFSRSLRKRISIWWHPSWKAETVFWFQNIVPPKWRIIKQCSSMETAWLFLRFLDARWSCCFLQYDSIWNSRRKWWKVRQGTTFCRSFRTRFFLNMTAWKKHWYLRQI